MTVGQAGEQNAFHMGIAGNEHRVRHTFMVSELRRLNLRP